MPKLVRYLETAHGSDKIRFARKRSLFAPGKSAAYTPPPSIVYTTVRDVHFYISQRVVLRKDIAIRCEHVPFCPGSSNHRPETKGNTITMLCIVNIRSLIIFGCTFSLSSAASPRSFNLSLSPHPTTRRSPWAAQEKVTCYVQPPFPKPRAPRVELDECEEAKELILVGDKTFAPMDFSADETKGYKVPKVWGCGRCQVVLHALDVDPSIAEDTFTLALVAQVASDIIEICIRRKPSQIGGNAKLGPKKIFEVVVSGVLENKANGTCVMHHTPILSTIANIETS